MAPGTITIRGADKGLFLEFKAEAVRERKRVGDVFNALIREWLSRHKPTQRKLSLLDIKPFDFGPGTENLSQEVDEVLYGWKR